jgi:short-subunit dehydrogenase
VAVRFYGEALAAKLKPYNIAVSIACPGFIKSRMTDANDFPMPFLMDTVAAVRRIKLGIERRAFCIQFPFIMVLALKFAALLPARLIRAIFATLPDKKSLLKH